MSRTPPEAASRVAVNRQFGYGANRELAASCAGLASTGQVKFRLCKQKKEHHHVAYLVATLSTVDPWELAKSRCGGLQWQCPGAGLS